MTFLETVTAASPAPWWTTPVWVGLLITVAKGIEALGKRAIAAVAASKKAHATAQVAQGREDTAQRKLVADADRGAFERAFDAKAEEHRECIEEVKELRGEIVTVNVKLARCEEQHEHAERERARDRSENAREIRRLREEIARVDRKTTPPGGTPAAYKKE